MPGAFWKRPWNGDDPGYIVRTRLAEYDRTGAYVPAEQALADFRADVEERLAKRAK